MSDRHLSTAQLTAWRDHGHGDRAHIVAHLAECAECRRLSAEVERDRPLAGDARPTRFRSEEFALAGRRAGQPSTPSGRLPRRTVYLAAAASLVLAAVVVPAWLTRDPGTATRGGVGVVVPVTPKDSVSIDALAFTWTAEPGAGALRLVVMALDDAGAPLVDREVSGTRYAPAAEERQRFQAGREYHWFVEYRGAGAGAGTSASARFRIR